MFNVGDLVTGNGLNSYGYTNKKSLCLITKHLSIGVDDIEVMIIGSMYRSQINKTYEVKSSKFRHTTVMEFAAEHPTAKFVDNISDYTNNATLKEEKKMNDLRMKKDATYNLTNEEREILRNEIMTLLKEYDYDPTTDAVDKIIDEWLKNKGWMIELFKKHPNYNGKFQIAFDADYVRNCDKNIVYSFFMYYINDIAKSMLVKEKQFGCFTYKEVKGIVNRLNDIIYMMDNLESYKGGHIVEVDGKEIEEFRRELNEWNELLHKMTYNNSIYISRGIGYEREGYEGYTNIKSLSDFMICYTDSAATEDLVDAVNSRFPNVKAVVGQKTSRIINKLFKLTGIDKHPDYNREFAKYSDTMNPLAIKRHTIISCHPVDYLTMSFGNSWASCHTIDKSNKRKRGGDHYNGCYSSGTLSYMLDESSFVFYTVDAKYNGNEYELQDKINRNMFHIGEDKLIQGRVYPQATDGESGIYRQIREIVQKVISDCLEVPNMWANFKGTDECAGVVYSYGTHYRDYTSYSDCNVSYLKGDGELLNKNRIKVGHAPICPSCGSEHEYEECIECYPCWEGEEECYECGNYHSRDDMYEIDGHWYCCECTFYCEYHNRREVWSNTTVHFVNGYGDICEDAFEESGEFYRCNKCGNIHRRDSFYHPVIKTSDGNTYCKGRCAEDDGYTQADDGVWYPDNEVYHCEHCDKSVHVSKWNSELECCTNCEDEVSAKNEEERVGA